MGTVVTVLIAPNPDPDPMDHEDHLAESFTAQQPTTSGGGHGLLNMSRRAEKLHGSLEIETPETGGDPSHLAGAYPGQEWK